ncbi:MAG: MotA/TolQ/ExbB proton channel family protein [Puniceicoccales bacterium]|jgi:biopolymer transport protein ExbB|nr:MotA/TolQ/ExbB proton channel family protein [Puniceicoccales bacterium]
MKIARLFRQLAVAATLASAAVALTLPFATIAQAQGSPAAPAATSTAAGTGGGATTVKVKEKTLWDELKQVNPIVLVALLAGSVLMIWFGVDGVIRTTHARAIPKIQVAQFREFFKAGDYVAAYNYAKSNFSPLSDVVRAGISFLPDGKVMTEEAMFGEIARINGTLMGRVSYLSVIGVCAPMVGLCGTVFGMMGAFSKLGESGIGDPSALSAEIGEVLVATATGLLLAIPAFILYYVLRNRITVILHDVQETASGLFRKMPYESFDGYHLGDDEIYAAQPNWVDQESPAATPAVQ